MATRQRKPSTAEVKLKAVGGSKLKGKFKIDRALKLLRMPFSQWVLDDAKYIFENDDIKRKPSNRKNQTTEE